MPMFGLGTWRSDKGKVATAVKLAILDGYRHIDAAWIYGNEKEVGQGLADALTESKELKREDIFITSKLWQMFHEPKYVEEIVKETLSNLGVSYLDLLLIHWPVSFEHLTDSDGFPKNDDGHFRIQDVPLKDTWKAMEELVSKGLVKSIGVSNFDEQDINEILEIATVKPVVNQVESHPYLVQKDLQEFCESKGIAITAYSPLGNIRPTAEDNVTPLEDPVVKEIAKAHGKTPAQVLIKWNIDMGRIVIPKTVTPARIPENANILDLELSNEELEKLCSLDRGLHTINPKWFKNEDFWPRRHDFEQAAAQEFSAKLKK
eukprot:GABV01000995.1.p1 GENE.GABV01000995.1~~GABV01000995.1.p1  ORF type:complete len:336 (+),score=169.52 GABV01000995.1:57-1010(+)